MAYKYTLMLLLVSTLASFASAKYEYDAEFWEGFDAEEKPFVHPWTDIPDLVDKPKIAWYFNMTHHFLLGIERGMYMNDSIELHEDCFGSKYVDKINMFAAMLYHDPQQRSDIENFLFNAIPAVAIIYQMYYMGAEKCSVDKTFNDLYLFCWNKGCDIQELWGNTTLNFLYMTRAIIDAAIVWQEGVPEDEDQDIQ